MVSVLIATVALLSRANRSGSECAKSEIFVRRRRCCLTKPPGTDRLVSGLFRLSSLLVYSRKQGSRYNWGSLIKFGQGTVGVVVTKVFSVNSC